MIAALTSALSHDITSGLGHLHGPIVFVVVAALVIAESGFVVGFFIPGEIAVVVGGVLAGQHHVELVSMLVVANAAAVAAFLVGYALGTLVGPWLLSHRWWREHAGVVRALGLMQRFGGLAVFLGRFVAVVRAVVPALTGVSEVRLRTFVIFDVAGGVVWATLYTMIGFALGDSYQRVLNDLGDWSIVLAAGLVVILLVYHQVSRRLLRHHSSAGRAPDGADRPPPRSPETQSSER